MKTIRIFLSENFQFLVVKFSIYLNRHVFVMMITGTSVYATVFIESDKGLQVTLIKLCGCVG